MPSPLKSKPSSNSRMKVAESRLSNLKRKLFRDTDLAKQYHDFVNDLIVKGEAELVSQNEIIYSSNTWYIPHFEAWYPKKSVERLVNDSAHHRAVASPLM